MSRGRPPSEREAASPPPDLGPSGGAPVLAGTGAGIAIGRQAGRAQVTALVLSLRRRAEADAQEALERVGGQLELGRRAHAQAGQLVAQAEKELLALLPPPALGPTAAEFLQTRSARLFQQQELVRARQHQLATEVAHLQTLVQQQGELHEALRLALARREAAELYQAEERREQRRVRAQRQRTLEEEARDRFLSAQRQAKSPRR